MGEGMCLASVYPRVRSARRGCFWRRLLFCERPSSRRSAPSGPSLSLIRYPPRLRAGDKPTLVSWFGFAIWRDVRVVQRAPFGCYASGRTPAAGRRDPRRGSVTLPESTFGFADHRRGLCFATRPLRMLRIRPDPRGWTPQPPVSKQGLVIKRFLGFCGSRSRRGWLWAAKSKPKRGFGQRHSHPLGGAASSLFRNRVRPNEVRRGRVAQHERRLESAQHNRISGRRFAPYPTEGSDGGQRRSAARSEGPSGTRG